MQKGIIIVDGGLVKEKRIYAGDVSSSTMNAYKLQLEEKYPNGTVTIYNSDKDAAFVSAVVGE